MRLVVLFVLSLYLVLVTFSAILGSIGARMITKRNMLLTLFSALVIVACTYSYLWQHHDSAIYGIAGGLFALSGIALSNGFQMHQKPHISHHVIRMVINVIFLLALYLVR
ncbi:hypothetical protein [Streptococcus pluranimalium]|uniref:hypothetical protein n=2 Tax=Streptococcus pluranimalium TaxID=82348 RepID=UPI003F6905EC